MACGSPPAQPDGRTADWRTADERTDLATLVRSSLRWVVAGQILRRGATWLSTILLARLFLSRADFGVAALGLSVSLVLLAANDLGVAAAITRNVHDIDRAFIGTARTLSAATSCALYVLLFLASPTIVGLVGVPAESTSTAVGVMRLFGLTLVIDGLAAPSAGLLARSLGERKRAVAETAGIATSLVVGITIAARGGGSWSLATGQVAAAAVSGLVLWRADAHRSTWAWDPTAAKQLTRFGLPLVGAGLLGQLVLNTDLVVVSRVLGAAAAGSFFLAFNIASWPVSLLLLALRRTALAGFARLGDTPGVLQGAFGASASLLLRTVVPVAALLGALAPDLVTTLYGPGWQDAVAPLRCLVGLSVLRLLFGLATDVLTALGRTAALPLVQAWWWLVLVVAMPLAAHRFGLRGVAGTEIAVALLLAAPCYATALRRAGIPLVGLGRRVARDLAPSVALVAGAVLAQRVLPTPTARLAGGLVLGGAAYGLALGTTRARRRSGEATLATILRQSRK